MTSPPNPVIDAIRALDHAQNVAVLVPSANPVVEPELNRLLPPTLRLYAARLPVMPGTTLEQRNRRYPDAYQAALDSFGALPLAAAIVGMTGPSYRLLPPGDAALAARLSRPSCPVQTASGAIAQALAAIGARRIALLSPYPQWLTDEAAAYWTAAGHTITQIVKTAAPDAGAYALTTQDVRTALAAIPHGSIDAVVMSGTGMLTLPALLAAQSPGAPPFLSSNLCCAWWLARTTAAGRSAAIHALAPALAATIPPSSAGAPP